MFFYNFQLLLLFFSISLVSLELTFKKVLYLPALELIKLSSPAAEDRITIFPLNFLFFF